MKRIAVIIMAGALMASCTSVRFSRHRLIHNNDGSDMLGNTWFGRRPLTVADINRAVDMVAETGATTYMICSGSDYAYYRSKYARVLGDDRDGTLDAKGDTLFLQYYRNFLNLEREGADMLETSLRRAKEDGMEAFITYRMNDIHFNDTDIPVPAYATDFWAAHPEYRMGEKERGWHADGAFDFSCPGVRRHKYEMIAEQLDRYPFIDGFEMDFMRFLVYFPSGKGPENAALMTDLVRKVRAKVDSVSAVSGHRIMLAVRVPQTWESCVDNGLEVNVWVKEKLVDFITIGNQWKGDPAIDADRFRKDSGIGKRTPIYVTIDDGMFKPREDLSHGMYRGAASFALSHGADGICLFNYYFREYVASGCKPKPELFDLVCRVRTPELARELVSLKSLEGRNKSLSYYCGTPEYGLKYLSPMPLTCSTGGPVTVDIFIPDKMQPHRPAQGLLFFRSGANIFSVTFNGKTLEPADFKYSIAYDRLRNAELSAVYCFIVPTAQLHGGENRISIECEIQPLYVDRLELILDYGDVKEHGYF